MGENGIPERGAEATLDQVAKAVLRLADTIEQRVTAGTQRADKLTQAVLAKAFRGELVPTEAELARREGRSYEPASALLERIQAERESAARKPNTSRRAKTTGGRRSG